jgi:hypothetical protein
MTASFISGPIPPYSNPPITPQYYQPRQYFISDITLGPTTTVTTSVDHDYVIGQLCRLLIPKGYGCYQLNEALGYVESIPYPDEVTLNINSQFADSFISADLAQQPQIVAVGDVNTGPINANGPQNYMTYIPGSFINISPN